VIGHDADENDDVSIDVAPDLVTVTNELEEIVRRAEPVRFPPGDVRVPVDRLLDLGLSVELLAGDYVQQLRWYGQKRAGDGDPPLNEYVIDDDADLQGSVSTLRELCLRSLDGKVKRRALDEVVTTSSSGSSLLPSRLPTIAASTPTNLRSSWRRNPKRSHR
jgi:hypothetical protein